MLSFPATYVATDVAVIPAFVTAYLPESYPFPKHFSTSVFIASSIIFFQSGVGVNTETDIPEKYPTTGKN